MSGMDLSFRRVDRGVSVFWMILALAVGAVALIALAIVLSETEDDVARSADSMEEAGPQTGAGTNPEGFADTTEDGRLIEEEGADTLLESGAGAAVAGDEADSAARTQDAPERGVTDAAANDELPAEDLDDIEDADGGMVLEQDAITDSPGTEAEAVESQGGLDQALPEPVEEAVEEEILPEGVEPDNAETLEPLEEGPTDLVVDPDDGNFVDPDGGAGAFFPTPSGPGGRDLEPLTTE